MPKVLVETLGTEELITNGSFTGNADGWTESGNPLPGAGWSYNNNKVIHAAGIGETEALNWIDVLPWDSGERLSNKKFLIKFTIGGTTGTVEVILGDSMVGESTIYDAGDGAIEIEYKVPWIIGNNDLFFYPSADFDGTIDSVSVIEYIPVATEIADPLKINSIIIGGHYVNKDVPLMIAEELIYNGSFTGSDAGWWNHEPEIG